MEEKLQWYVDKENKLQPFDVRFAGIDLDTGCLVGKTDFSDPKYIQDLYKCVEVKVSVNEDSLDKAEKRIEFFKNLYNQIGDRTIEFEYQAGKKINVKLFKRSEWWLTYNPCKGYMSVCTIRLCLIEK